MSWSSFVASLINIRPPQLPGMPRILSLQLDRKGRRLLANCSDRVIRLVNLTSPPAQQLPAPFSAEEAPARARTQPKVCMQFLTVNSDHTLLTVLGSVDCRLLQAGGFMVCIAASHVSGW